MKLPLRSRTFRTIHEIPVLDGTQGSRFMKGAFNVRV